MAPKYVLSYFPIQGLAEPIRLILAYGKIDFEDERITFEDWPKHKDSMPLGQMPVLKIGDKTINHATSICRYLSKQFGLAGTNDWENLQIDMAVETIHDLRLRVALAFYESDEALQAKKYEDLVDFIPFYLEKLDGFAKANKGYMAIGKLTWADFLFAGLYDYLMKVTRQDIGAKYPNLQAVIDKVRGLPDVKAWLANSPKTDW